VTQSEPAHETNAVEDSVTDDDGAVPDDAAVEPPNLLSDLDLAPAIEAIVMVVDQPVSTLMLAQVLQRTEDDVVAACAQLAGEYRDQGRGFELREVAGGWRFYSSPQFDSVVQQFVLDGQQARLTQAALETLAVVAYRQPVSRARISAIRGVNVDAVMRTLLARGLVEESGTDGENGAHLYRTTEYFLERLGITSLEDLPELAPYLPDLETLEAEL
jgi:segregation and condensation protein B